MTNLAANANLSANINEAKKEIPRIINLATVTILTDAEIKYLMLVKLAASQKSAKLKIKLLLIMLCIIT